MERNPGLEALDTISLLEEPTSPPGAVLRCGSRTSHSPSPSSSDPPALTRDTLVCMEATELTNGVNHSRAATKGTRSKDTTTTTQHTIKANTLNNPLLLPLTKLYKITILTTSRFSFLTFPSDHNYQDRQTLTFFQIAHFFVCPARAASRLLFPWCSAVPGRSLLWYFFLMVCQNVHSIWTV